MTLEPAQDAARVRYRTQPRAAAGAHPRPVDQLDAVTALELEVLWPGPQPVCYRPAQLGAGVLRHRHDRLHRRARAAASGARTDPREAVSACMRPRIRVLLVMASCSVRAMASPRSPKLRRRVAS